MDPTVTPAAAPAAPAAAPAAPAPDPVKTNSLASILGLVKPEESTIKPPSAPTSNIRDVSDDDDDDVPPKPAVVETKPAEPAKPAEEAKPAETKPAEAKPAEPAPKKVEVKKSKTSVADEIKRAVKEALPTPVVPAAPVTPTAPVTPAVVEPTPADDLTPEEREEFELAVFAEKKDPAKYKGIAEKFSTFYKKQKEFLEAALAKAAADGEDYDPKTDPKFQRFLAANEPKLSGSERKALFRDKVVEEAKVQAVREAEARFAPKTQAIEREVRVMRETPVIAQRLNAYVNEVAHGMPEEVLKYHLANGSDVEKTKAQFPLEFDIISKQVNGAAALAKSFLAVRKGLEDFNPVSNGHHKFLDEFITNQAAAFQRNGGASLVRNGRQFLPPAQWTAEKAATHWTFSDEDVLGLLRAQSQNEAKAKIASEKKRLADLGFVPAPKVSAPAGAKPAAPETPSSPRLPSSALPGAAAASATPSGSRLTSMLGLA